MKVQRGHAFTKNKPSFSQQPSVIDNPSARMGLHAHFPLHCWGFLWLEPLQVMHAVTIATVPFIPIFDIGKLRLSDVPKVKHLLMRSTPIRVFCSLTSTLSPHHIMASILELRHLEKPLQADSEIRCLHALKRRGTLATARTCHWWLQLVPSLLPVLPLIAVTSPSLAHHCLSSQSEREREPEPSHLAAFSPPRFLQSAFYSSIHAEAPSLCRAAVGVAPAPS